MPRGRTVRTAEKEKFLAALSAGGSVSAACRAGGIGRSSAYQWRDADADFRAAWEAAYDDGTDRYEDALRVLAMKGDIAALIYTLKRRRPQVYARRMLDPDASAASEGRGQHGSTVHFHLPPDAGSDAAPDQETAIPVHR